MTAEQTVSVVMPAFDVAAYVGDAVASVHGQDWPRIELIAVDDGSSDGTGDALERIARGWTVPGRTMRVLRQRNLGAAAARNAGLAAATGAHLCLMDADDRMDPGLIARTVGRLRADPTAALAAPTWRYVDARGAPTGIAPMPAALRHDAAGLVVEGPLQSATGVTVRMADARRAGPFDAALRGCIDLDWCVRLVAAHGGAAVTVPGAQADYRKRAGQITADWRRMRDAWEAVVAKMDAAGHGLTRGQLRRARARNRIFWATVAYQGGEHAAARALVRDAWLGAPLRTAGDAHARIRTLAVLASLLPAPVHDGLRRRAAAHSARSKQ